MELYDMTYLQYCEHYLQNNRYKATYIAKPNLWEQRKSELLNDWKKVLLDRARVEPLRHQVIQSYIRLFGEKALWSTFRGVYERGVSHFRIPMETRR